MVILTMLHGIMQCYCAKTTTTLTLFNTAQKVHSVGGTADGDKTDFFGHCRPYHMVLVWRKITRTEFYGENFGANVLSLKDFHIVWL